MFLRRWLYFVLVCLLMMFFVSCGSAPSSSTGTTGGTGGSTGTVIDNNTDSVSDISLVAASNQMRFNDTLTVNFYLYDKTGNLILKSKKVSFSLDNPSLAQLSTGSVTTLTGQGSVTVTSRTSEGEFKIFASVDNITKEYKVKVSNIEPPASISLTAVPDNITVLGTSNIKAYVKTSSGANVADGTVVTFEIDNPVLGQITSSAITYNGIATATFSASTIVGKPTITAKAGTKQSSVLVNIKAAATSSIIFDKADPQLIALAGTGQLSSSKVTFIVKDDNSNPVSTPVQVKIELSGPGGGEYLVDSTDGKSVTVSTVNGIATAILNSGTVPGTVTLVATIVGTNISTSSGVISIGGGVPSAARFSLSTNRFNYEGLILDNIQGDMNVLLADRYGNTNILANTTVKFFSECGGIENAAILDATGAGKVKFRTQAPKPYYTVVDNTSTRDVLKGEYNYLVWFDSIFKTNFRNGTKPEDPNPRDGFCTITAVVDGEEAFNDLNGNGKYDLGEPFTDTYDDVYEDADDNYQFSSNSIWMYNELSDSYKQYSEKLIAESPYSKDGVFTGFNDKWDSNKKIYKNIKLLMTGYPQIYWILESIDNPTKVSSSFNRTLLSFVSGERLRLRVLVGDRNFNLPIKGTKFHLNTTDRTSLVDNSPVELFKISGSYQDTSFASDISNYVYQDSFDYNYKIFEYNIQTANSTTFTKSCQKTLYPEVLFSYGTSSNVTITDMITFYVPCP